MTSEVSLTISKILNWSADRESSRVQVAFYGVSSGSYLSHKTALGYSSAQTFVLNTSFRIHYNPQEHLISCKITNLESKNGPQAIGSAQIDLQLLSQKRLLYVPFQEHDKVLQVRLYQEPKEPQPGNQGLRSQREEFLQKRFDFMEKIANHEAELKKKFSERVYGFLKELKNRNVSEGLNERQSPRSVQTDTFRTPKYRNELEFRNRLENERKAQLGDDMLLSPKKRKGDELMIHSVRTGSPQKDMRSPTKEDLLELNSRQRGAFGGLLDFEK